MARCGVRCLFAGPDATKGHLVFVPTALGLVIQTQVSRGSLPSIGVSAPLQTRRTGERRTAVCAEATIRGIELPAGVAGDAFLGIYLASH